VLGGGGDGLTEPSSVRRHGKEKVKLYWRVKAFLKQLSRRGGDPKKILPPTTKERRPNPTSFPERLEAREVYFAEKNNRREGKAHLDEGC